jgi:hypothetical protein
MDIEKVKKLLKRIEYIALSDVFGDFVADLAPEHYSRFRFCPDCGYKHTDGHWRDCELSSILESLESE